MNQRNAGGYCCIFELDHNNCCRLWLTFPARTRDKLQTPSARPLASSYPRRSSRRPRCRVARGTRRAPRWARLLCALLCALCSHSFACPDDTVSLIWTRCTLFTTSRSGLSKSLTRLSRAPFCGANRDSTFYLLCYLHFLKCGFFFPSLAQVPFPTLLCLATWSARGFFCCIVFEPEDEEAEASAELPLIELRSNSDCISCRKLTAALRALVPCMPSCPPAISM